MKCTYCGEEKSFQPKMEMTIKSSNGVWTCAGAECEKCGVSNFDWAFVDGNMEIKDVTPAGQTVEIK